MPSARDRTAVAANAGFRNKLRKASFIEGDSEQLSFQWAALNQRRCARTWAATVRSRIAPFGNGHSRVGQPILAAGKIACPTSNRPRQPTRARGGAGRNVQPQQSCQAQPSTEESESLRYQIGTSNEGRGGRCGATCPMPSPSTAWSCSHLATHKELVRKIEQIEAAQKQQARTRTAVHIRIAPFANGHTHQPRRAKRGPGYQKYNTSGRTCPLASRQGPHSI